MKYIDKELEKYLFTEEEIKKQMEEEKYFYDRTITKYKDIKSYNECDDDEDAKKEYIKKIGNKYVFFYGEEKDEEFETLKEVEDYLCGVKASELFRINRQLSLLDDNYFYARVSILYKNLQKKVDSSEISLELEEWIKEWIKDSIDFRPDYFMRMIMHNETEIVGNYLYIPIKDDNHDGIYGKININTLEKEIAKEVDYYDFIINKDIKQKRGKVMKTNSKKTNFYAYDDGKLKRVNKCMTELTETKKIDIYEKDKNGNNKTVEMIKVGKGLPKIHQEDKKGR